MDRFVTRRERRGERERRNREVQRGPRDETGFRLDPSPPSSFPPCLTLEWFQSPTRLPKSESLNVFATSSIVYRKQAKPLKLTRGSSGLYIQTPINTAVSPRHSACSSLLKFAEF